MKKGKIGLLFFCLSLFACFSLSALTGCNNDKSSFEDYTENLNANIQTSSGTLDNGMEYAIFNDRRAAITGYKGSETEIVIPDKIENKPVFAIYSEAFKDNSQIVSITLSDYILWIYSRAFAGCVNLKNINMSNRLTVIFNNAFEGCSSLTEISFPDSIEELREQAFYNCVKLSSINFPDKDKIEFHHDVFENTLWLESKESDFIVAANAIIKFNIDEDVNELVIPQGVKTIAIGASLDNSAIETLRFPSSLIDYGSIFVNLKQLNNVFVDNNNTKFASLDGVLFNKDMTYLLYYPVKKAKEIYVIPEGVTYVDSRLNHNQNLKTLIIPQTLSFDMYEIELITDELQRFNVNQNNFDTLEKQLKYVLKNIFMDCEHLETIKFKASQSELSSEVEAILKQKNDALEIVWGYGESN